MAIEVNEFNRQTKEMRINYLQPALEKMSKEMGPVYSYAIVYALLQTAHAVCVVLDKGDQTKAAGLYRQLAALFDNNLSQDPTHLPSSFV